MTTTTIEVDATVAAAIAAALAERDVALSLAESADVTGWDRKVIDQAIAAFAAAGRPFSANDVRPLLPEVRPSLVGARFMAASVRGEIRRAGLTTSTKKNTHGKDVALWVGVAH